MGGGKSRYRYKWNNNNNDDDQREGLIKEKNTLEPSPCPVRIPNRSVEIALGCELRGTCFSMYMNNIFSGASSFNQPLHAPWYHEESESE